MLRLAFGMALVAVFLADDDRALVPLGHLGGPVQHEADQELVLLGDGQMMAIMAVELLVLALRPAVVGRLHQVAADAELGIVLGKIIELVGNETAAARR